VGRRRAGCTVAARRWAWRVSRDSVADSRRPGAPEILMLSSVLPERCAWFFGASEGFLSSTSPPSHLLELPAASLCQQA
jgi:hypothetical protein